VNRHEYSFYTAAILLILETQMPLNRRVQFGVLLLLSLPVSAQRTATHRSHRRPNPTTKETWVFSALADGYFVPGEQGYVDPIFTADHCWLHLEARYNYEDLKTGSLFLGYNLNLTPAKNLDMTLTPMLGGVFGRTTGLAPAFVASLTYQKLNLWVSNEYVFDTGDHSSSYFYTWPQLTYTPVDWLHVGLVAQRTQAIQTDIQGGFLFGLSHNKTEFTSYILDPGSKPTVVLELGYNF
jgi:hypothetical protein